MCEILERCVVRELLLMKGYSHLFDIVMDYVTWIKNFVGKYE